jgi:hypothetical protein
MAPTVIPTSTSQSAYVLPRLVLKGHKPSSLSHMIDDMLEQSLFRPLIIELSTCTNESPFIPTRGHHVSVGEQIKSMQGNHPDKTYATTNGKRSRSTNNHDDATTNDNNSTNIKHAMELRLSRAQYGEYACRMRYYHYLDTGNGLAITSSNSPCSLCYHTVCSRCWPEIHHGNVDEIKAASMTCPCASCSLLNHLVSTPTTAAANATIKTKINIIGSHRGWNSKGRISRRNNHHTYCCDCGDILLNVTR